MHYHYTIYLRKAKVKKAKYRLSFLEKTWYVALSKRQYFCVFNRVNCLQKKSGKSFFIFSYWEFKQLLPGLMHWLLSQHLAYKKNRKNQASSFHFRMLNKVNHVTAYHRRHVQNSYSFTDQEKQLFFQLWKSCRGVPSVPESMEPASW